MDITSKKTYDKISLLNNVWTSLVICAMVISGTTFPLFSYIAFFLSLGLILVLPNEHVLCFLIFIMPFANIFKASPSSQSFFTYLLFFYVLVTFFKKKKADKAFVISFMLFALFLVFQFSLSVNITRTIKFLANLLLIYCAISFKIRMNFEKVFLFYILGIVFSSLVAIFDLIPNLNSFIPFQDLGYHYDYALRFSGLYADPNYYAINVIISLCLVVILNLKKTLNSAVSILLAVFLLWFAIETISKSAFFMLVFPFAMLIYSKIKQKKYFVFAILTIGAIVLIYNIFLGKFDIFATVLKRLITDSQNNAITTGRDVIWGKYIAFFMKSGWQVIFGGGFGAGLVDGYGAHNTYIDLIYYLGIVGVVLLGIVFYTILAEKSKIHKKNFLNYSIWLCIGTMYFFLSQLFYFDWPFHIILAIFVCKLDFNTEEGAKDEKNFL